MSNINVILHKKTLNCSKLVEIGSLYNTLLEQVKEKFMGLNCLCQMPVFIWSPVE